MASSTPPNNTPPGLQTVGTAGNKSAIKELEKTLDLYQKKIPSLQPTPDQAEKDRNPLIAQSAPKSNWTVWSKAFLKWVLIYCPSLHGYLQSLHSVDTEIKTETPLQLPPLPVDIADTSLLRATGVLTTTVSADYGFLIEHCGPTEVVHAYFALLKYLIPNVSDLRIEEITKYHRSVPLKNETCTEFGTRLLNTAKTINSRMGKEHIKAEDVEATFKSGLALGPHPERYKSALGLLKFQKHLNYSDKMDFVAQNSDESQVVPIPKQPSAASAVSVEVG
jgi:hypothetical protein